MLTFRRRPARRLLAGFMLAGLVLSWGGPLIGRSPAASCPLAPESSNSAAVTAAMDNGTCEHTDAAPCVSTLGCIAPAPAIQAPGVPVVVSLSFLIAVAYPASHFGDLYRSGPPTPPPNLI